MNPLARRDESTLSAAHSIGTSLLGAVVVNGVHIAVDMAFLFVLVLPHGFEKLRPAQPVRGPGADRQKATTNFVFPLRAGFKCLQLIRNAIVDALVITGLEVQGVVVRTTPPVSAVKGIRALVKDCGGDNLFVQLGDNHQDVVRE